MAHVDQRIPGHHTVEQNKQTQRQDVVAARLVLPVLVEAAHKALRGHDLVTSGDSDQSVVAVKLCGHKPFNGVVYWIEPVHKDPEVREVARLDHETAEQVEHGDAHTTKH